VPWLGIDRFGPLPGEVENLLEIIAIKRLCRDAGAAKVEAAPKGAVLRFHNDRFANPAGLVRFLQEQVGTAKLRPDQHLVVMRQWEETRERLRIHALLRHLAEIAAAASKKYQPLWRRSPQQKLRSHAAEHRRLLVLVSCGTRQLKNERNGIAKREFVRTQIPSTGVSHALSVRSTPLAFRINCRARSGARRAGSSPR
jgi:hypothetical protein